MRLLPDEEMITTSGGDTLRLTNQRIRFRSSSWGKYYQLELFLSDISSIESKYKINHFHLILAIAACLSSFALEPHMQKSTIGMAPWAVAALFAVLWLFSRRHIIKIASNGGAQMYIKVSGMSDSSVQDFIYSIQDAKLKSRQISSSITTVKTRGIAS